MPNENQVIRTESVSLYTKEGTRNVIAKIMNIPLSELIFDPENPRTYKEQQQQMAEDGTGLTQEQCFELLWKKDAVKDLAADIRIVGGLKEKPDVDDNGMLIEGNSRTAALKHLESKLNESEYWDTEQQREDIEKLFERGIECRVFSGLSKQLRTSLLFDHHVRTKNPWDSWIQAMMIKKMADEGLSTREVARIMQKGKSVVAMKIQAFEWANEYFRKNNYQDVALYSRFEELYKIRKTLRENGLNVELKEHMDLFHKSLDSGQIVMAIDTRRLAKAITAPKCKELILDGEFREAIELYKTGAPEMTSARYAAIKRALDNLNSFTADDLKALKEDTHRELLDEVKKGIERVIKMSEVV